jgi:hypothetical protein
VDIIRGLRPYSRLPLQDIVFLIAPPQNRPFSPILMDRGSLGVALVQRQVMLVQGASIFSTVLFFFRLLTFFFRSRALSHPARSLAGRLHIRAVRRPRFPRHRRPTRAHILIGRAHHLPHIRPSSHPRYRHARAAPSGLFRVSRVKRA